MRSKNGRENVMYTSTIMIKYSKRRIEVVNTSNFAGDQNNRKCKGLIKQGLLYFPRRFDRSVSYIMKGVRFCSYQFIIIFLLKEEDCFKTCLIPAFISKF